MSHDSYRRSVHVDVLSCDSSKIRSRLPVKWKDVHHWNEIASWIQETRFIFEIAGVYSDMTRFRSISIRYFYAMMFPEKGTMIHRFSCGDISLEGLVLRLDRVTQISWTYFFRGSRNLTLTYHDSFLFKITRTVTRRSDCIPYVSIHVFEGRIQDALTSMDSLRFDWCVDGEFDKGFFFFFFSFFFFFPPDFDVLVSKHNVCPFELSSIIELRKFEDPQALQR